LTPEASAAVTQTARMMFTHDRLDPEPAALDDTILVFVDVGPRSLQFAVELRCRVKR
jgi:hypothetical protein